MRRALALAALVVALTVSGCGGSGHETATSPSSPSSQTLDPSTRLVDLQHPGRTPALFTLFNADQGEPRLVLLISPT